MTRLLALPLVALGLLAGCAGSPPGEGVPEPSGPPEVRAATVETHAEQFDTEVPERRAGSQEEQIAATYILGHLQQAGYASRLDRVPVGDLVNSTNVIATRPQGPDPTAIVAVAYDSESGASSSGRALGLFLELARAVTVADADHAVQFAALGAENSELEGGGHRGARELARGLESQGREPVVIVVGDVTPTGPAVGAGDAPALGEAGIGGRASVAEGPNRKAAQTSMIFSDAGYESAWVSGGAAELGAALLEGLAG